MCLTAYFIDRNWLLIKRILNFYPISSHMGQQMEDAIDNYLLVWNLDNVFYSIVDNVSSNSVIIIELSKQFDMLGTNILDGKNLHIPSVPMVLHCCKLVATLFSQIQTCPYGIALHCVLS